MRWGPLPFGLPRAPIFWEPALAREERDRMWGQKALIDPNLSDPTSFSTAMEVAYLTTNLATASTIYNELFATNQYS